MPSTRSTDEFNAAVAEKVEEFKLAFIEQMKSNLREVFKDEIRQIIKEELKEIEKLSSTVSLLQKHVNTLRESNVALQEKCNNLEHLVECNEQYSRRTCLRITNIPCEKDETSEKVLEKIKRLVNEAGVDIPDSNIDRAHRIGPKKEKKQAIIVKFTTFRHRTLLYRARRKLKNGVKLHIDLSKKRFKLLLDAQKYVENVGEVQFVYADINCNLKVKFRNNDESFFTSMQELEDFLDK